jgi:hypothetical protein
VRAAISAKLFESVRQSVKSGGETLPGETTIGASALVLLRITSSAAAGYGSGRHRTARNVL